MNIKKCTATSMSEVLVTLGLIGILAVTMLGLNNFDDKRKINEAKMAQAEAAIKTWGKAISQSNETGLGTTKVLQSQESLNTSLIDFLKLNATAEKNFKFNDENITAASGFILDNGVTMAAKQLGSTCDSSKSNGDPCGVISLKIDDLQSNQVIFSDGVKSEEDIFAGYEKYPYIPTGTVIDNSDPKNPIVCLSASGCYCTQTPCTNPQPAPEGTCTDAKNVYVAPVKTDACGVGENGSITTTKVTSLLGQEVITTVNSCCDNPKIAEFNANGEKTCVCDKKVSKVEIGYGFDKYAPDCQTICPKGKYQQKQDCVLCETNKYCDREGLAFSLDCPKGYYCPDDTETLNINKAYHIDKYTLENDKVVAVEKGGLIDKVICPIGHFCPTENANAPKICPVGHYCPEEGMTEAKKCPAGTYQDEEGQTSCKTCDANYYCATPGLDKQTHCVSGSYSDAGSTFCKQCEAGGYFDEEKQGCKPCPMGQYQDLYGQTSCKACEIGTYQNEEGQTECKSCEIGSYTDKEGLTSCTKCPENSTTTQSNTTSISKCLCNAGYGLKEQTEFSKDTNGNIFGACMPVPCGTYSPENTNEIIDCPDTDGNRFDVGYTTQEGSKAVKDCKLRTATQYWADKNKCKVQECPKGKIPNSDNSGCKCPDQSCPGGMTVNEKTCQCEETYMCPAYDKVYAVRWKTMVAPQEIKATEEKYLPTVYNQLAGIGSNASTSYKISVINAAGILSTNNSYGRTVTESMKNVAELLSESDKKLSFDKFYAHIIGVNYETTIEEQEYDYLQNSSAAFVVCIDDEGNVTNVSEKEETLANGQKLCGNEGHIPTEAELKKHFDKIKQGTTIDGKIWTADMYKYRTLFQYTQNGAGYQRATVSSLSCDNCIAKTEVPTKRYNLLCKQENSITNVVTYTYKSLLSTCSNNDGLPTSADLKAYSYLPKGYYRTNKDEVYYSNGNKKAHTLTLVDNYDASNLRTNLLCKRDIPTSATYSKAQLEKSCSAYGGLPTKSDLFSYEKLLKGSYRTNNDEVYYSDGKGTLIQQYYDILDITRVIPVCMSGYSPRHPMAITRAEELCSSYGGFTSYAGLLKFFAKNHTLLAGTYVTTDGVFKVTTSFMDIKTTDVTNGKDAKNPSAVICENGKYYTNSNNELVKVPLYQDAYNFCQQYGSNVAKLNTIRYYILKQQIPIGTYWVYPYRNEKELNYKTDRSWEHSPRLTICNNGVSNPEKTMTYKEAYAFCQNNGGIPTLKQINRLDNYLLRQNVWYWTSDELETATNHSKVFNVAQKITEAKVITSVTPRAWFYKVATGLTEEDPINMAISETTAAMCVKGLHKIKKDGTFNLTKTGQCVCETEANIKKAKGFEDYFNEGKYDANFLACKSADLDTKASMKQSDYKDVSTETPCKEICIKDLCPYKPVPQTNKDGSIKKDAKGNILYVKNQYKRSCNKNEEKKLLASNDYLTCMHSCEYYRSKALFSYCRNRSGYSLGTEFCTGGTISCSANSSRTYRVAEIFRRHETPLILDLNGDDYKFTSLEDGVNFDIDGDGYIQKVAWTDVQTEFDDAFLILDKNKNGQVDNGKELFGDQNGAQTGFDELRKYDDNGDSVINKKDKTYFELQLWCDMNKNAIVDEGELKTLEEAGVTELSVNFTMEKDKNGNLLTDIYGNITGLVGQFKMLLEDAAGKLIEVVRKMIDVLLLST